MGLSIYYLSPPYSPFSLHVVLLSFFLSASKFPLVLMLASFQRHSICFYCLRERNLVSTQCDLPQSSDPERVCLLLFRWQAPLGLTCLNMTPGSIDTGMNMGIKVLPVPH